MTGISNLRVSPSTRQSLKPHIPTGRNSDLIMQTRPQVSPYSSKIITTSKKRTSSPFESQHARAITPHDVYQIPKNEAYQARKPLYSNQEQFEPKQYNESR